MLPHLRSPRKTNPPSSPSSALCFTFVLVFVSNDKEKKRRLIKLGRGGLGLRELGLCYAIGEEDPWTPDPTSSKAGAQGGKQGRDCRRKHDRKESSRVHHGWLGLGVFGFGFHSPTLPLSKSMRTVSHFVLSALVSVSTASS